MRLEPKIRKDQILCAAMRVAARPGGWSSITRTDVAQEAQCSDGSVSKYFGTMAEFKRTIMRAAIKGANLAILAQGLAAGDKHALKADNALKLKAITTLSE